jgi:hypothetical protein
MRCEGQHGRRSSSFFYNWLSRQQSAWRARATDILAVHTEKASECLIFARYRTGSRLLRGASEKGQAIKWYRAKDKEGLIGPSTPLNSFESLPFLSLKARKNNWQTPASNKIKIKTSISCQ